MQTGRYNRTMALTQISETLQIPTEPVWPLTVEQYHRMVAAGILTPDDPIELLAGWLVQKMTKNPPHRIADRLVRLALEALVPPGWYVEAQQPITLEGSEPEPDIALIRGETTDYGDRHPQASDIGLVIEIADATLERDRTLKQRIYAEAAIAQYWIVNLNERVVEVYTEPTRKGYQHCQVYSSTELPVRVNGETLGALSLEQLWSQIPPRA
jgi:Uma2 family endonuclease